MVFDMRTHNVKTRAGKSTLTRVNPHVRLKTGDDPPVFIQGGRFYAENGEEYINENLPKWVPAEVAKLNDTALREAGILDEKGAPVQFEEGKAALDELNKSRGWGQRDPTEGGPLQHGDEVYLGDDKPVADHTGSRAPAAPQDKAPPAPKVSGVKVKPHDPHTASGKAAAEDKNREADIAAEIAAALDDPEVTTPKSGETTTTKVTQAQEKAKDKAKGK